MQKGMFIWIVSRLEQSIPEIVQHCVTNNYTHLLVKFAHGIYSYNYVGGRDYVKEIVLEAHQHGLIVIGWHYVFGDDPINEGRTAVRRIQQTGVDEYCINAEGHFRDQSNNSDKAEVLVAEIRNNYPTIPISLSSYRYPIVHPKMPWNTWAQLVDYWKPQVYWIHANNPAEQLQMCLSQYEKYGLPIIPTGAAFKEHGWQPTESEVQEFMEACVTQNLTGFDFWEWYHAFTYLPHLGQTIDEFDPDSFPAPPPVPAGQEFKALTNVNYRSEPRVAPSTYVGTFNKGAIIHSERVVSPYVGQLWLEFYLDERKLYSALTYKGVQYWMPL